MRNGKDGKSGSAFINVNGVILICEFGGNTSRANFHKCD